MLTPPYATRLQNNMADRLIAWCTVLHLMFQVMHDDAVKQLAF